MDSLDDKKNILKHVFNFNDDSKAEMLNIVQYAVVSMIPVIILNKTLSRYIPEVDDEKGSLEITAEVIIQVITMFIGLLIIHRINTFIPTYSGSKYPDFNITFIILAVLMITMSLQTKIGEKVSILVSRVQELWDGKKEETPTKKKSVKQNVVQQNTNNAQNQSQQQGTGTSINNLPSIAQPGLSQELPNYNNMHSNDTTQMVNASTPGGEMDMFEPMAANDAIGGNGFGSW